MWFYGAGDGHWIRAQMRDGNNAAFPVDFTESNPEVTTVEGTSHLLTDKAGEMRIHEVTLED